MTYEEIIFEIQDLCKNISDDASINEDHILVIINQIRASLLQQKYKSIKKEVSHSNYQTVLIELTTSNNNDCFKSSSSCNTVNLIVSTDVIPKLLNIGNDEVTPVDYYQNSMFAYVSPEQMRFAGYNPALKNVIYASKGPDGRLYLKSANPQILHLKKVRLTGVFEDALKASELDCNADCDLFKREFPLEEDLISILVDTAVKIVTGSIYKPADIQNDANDNLSDLAAFIRKNVKSALQKQIEE